MSNEVVEPEPRTQPRPVVIMSSVLAGLNVFVAGTAFVSVVPGWVAGLAALIVAAVTVAWGAYVNGVVTPYSRVSARVRPDGVQVAGPASVVPDNTPVDVVRSDDPGWLAPPPVAPPE